MNRTMHPNPKPKRRPDPESEFYDRLKGNQVEIVHLHDGSALTGKLVWVSRYSVGFVDQTGHEYLVNKGAIGKMRLYQPTGKRTNGSTGGDST